MKPVVIFCLAMLIFNMGCKSSRQATVAPQERVSEQKLTGAPVRALPSVVVYKTTRDFSDHVPVTLDARHEHIVSYPAPTDVYYQGRLAKPTALADGYWLDNRGIGEHVAFLDYTYEEYSRLAEVPSREVLESRILERYPLVEMYVCGKREGYADEVSELNALIREGFKGCRKVDLPKPMSITRSQE